MAYRRSWQNFITQGALIRSERIESTVFTIAAEEITAFFCSNSRGIVGLSQEERNPLSLAFVLLSDERQWWKMMFKVKFIALCLKYIGLLAN